MKDQHSHSPQSAPAAGPQHPNPGLGLGDIGALLQTIEEAVLAGRTQIPAIKIRIAGKRITLGPTPLSVD